MLCELYKDKGSNYAAEDMDTHTLCGYELWKALGMKATDPTENLTWSNQGMDECTSGYADYILELVEAVEGPRVDTVIVIEQRVDVSR